MKKKFLLLFFLGVIFLVSAQKTNAAIDGHLRVTSPNGGESYTEGDTITITWDASSNIDKMMLGYSSGPGNLNWIATSIPNTGSYTWNVDVGNTTKTQFVIDITGYETGKGSLSDKSDGWFTVNQKSEFPATPEPEPEPTPEPEPAPEPVQEQEPEPTPEPATKKTEQPKPTEVEEERETPSIIINQQTTIVSITQIEINEYYYFEDSKSTDLSQVNPEQVEDFTLDRQNLMYFTFLGETDLSTEKAVDTFEDLDEMVYMDYFYFWFEWEFWILFETDVEAVFYDTTDTLTASSPITLNGKTLGEDEYKIEEKENGENKVVIAPEVINKHVKEGEKIKIEIKPSLEVNFQPDQIINSDSSDFTLKGSVSNKDSEVVIHYNGEKIVLAINEQGEFEKVLDLREGENEIKVMAYQDDAKEPYSTINGKINYQVPASEKNFSWLMIAIPTILLIIAVSVLVLKRK